MDFLVFVGLFLFFYLTKRFYFDGERCHSKARLDGKTAIVTGSNTGLGSIYFDNYSVVFIFIFFC
jgi:hypothetical protein